MMKKALAAVVTLAVLICSVTSCGKSAEYDEYTFYAMDTYVTLRVSSDGKNADFDKLCDKCSDIVSDLESLMSAHDESSRLYDFNNGGADVSADEGELYSVISTADKISRETDGAYRCTIGALSLLWNVTGGGPVPSPAGINDALEHISCDALEFSDSEISLADDECTVDLGGIAKGYAAQKLVEYLSGSGVEYGLVSMGGNIGVFGEKPNGEDFRVGICDPNDTSKVACYLNINSGFTSVSGSYERFFEEDGLIYHHILDPNTGYPSESELLSVAVKCENGAMSDAISTALFVMGEKGTSELYENSSFDFEAVLITKDGEIVLTDGIEDDDFELAAENYTVRRLAR